MANRIFHGYPLDFLMRRAGHFRNTAFLFCFSCFVASCFSLNLLLTIYLFLLFVCVCILDMKEGRVFLYMFVCSMFCTMTQQISHFLHFLG